MLTQALLWAAGGSGFTFLMTALGAATVFLFRRTASARLHRIMLGFAAGVMIAASMWSLLIPAIEQSQAAGGTGWIPAAGGSVLGIAFLAGMDVLLPHLTPELLDRGSGERGHRNTLLVLAITMHNIPEGMAVGISFAPGCPGGHHPAPCLYGPGPGHRDPELSRGRRHLPPPAAGRHGPRRAFLMGAASGIVEPIAALLTVLAAGTVQPLMPWLLSFAAGAMLYVVVEELIPEANLRHDHETHGGTFGVMAGFLIMMILDVALG